MSNKKMKLDVNYKLEKKVAGTIVLGKLGSYHWWPAIIIKPSDCGQSNAKFDYLWLFWFGDHKISEISRKKIVGFTSNFSRLCVGISGKTLQKAILEALEILATRCSFHFENTEALMSWAEEGFNCTDEALISSTDIPPFVFKHLDCLKKSKASEDDIAAIDSDSADQDFKTNIPLKMVRDGSLKIQDLCIACYESKTPIIAYHPLFEGGLCFPCKDRLQENMYAFGNDGKSVCVKAQIIKFYLQTWMIQNATTAKPCIIE